MNELDEIVQRTVREIKRAKIRTPDLSLGESVMQCHWSRTGWAVQNADGSCTCQPTNAPERGVEPGEIVPL